MCLVREIYHMGSLFYLLGFKYLQKNFRCYTDIIKNARTKRREGMA